MDSPGSIERASRERYFVIIATWLCASRASTLICGCTEAGLLISPEDHPGLPGIACMSDAAIDFAPAHGRPI